jgi:hypothetical protein
MSERAHYKTLRSHLCRPTDRMDRVENGVMAGMPDINLCAEGVEVWIEMKSPVEPKRSGTPLFGSNHRLSIDQENWFIRQCIAGGRAFVLISTDKRWILIDGRDITLINTSTTLFLLTRAAWTALKPVRGEDPWNALRYALMYSRPNPLPINSAASSVTERKRRSP